MKAERRRADKMPNADKEVELDLVRAKRLVQLWAALKPATRNYLWARLHDTGSGCPARVPADASLRVRSGAKGCRAVRAEEATVGVLRGHQSGCCRLCGGHRGALVRALERFIIVEAGANGERPEETLARLAAATKPASAPGP